MDKWVSGYFIEQIDDLEVMLYNYYYDAVERLGHALNKGLITRDEYCQNKAKYDKKLSDFLKVHMTLEDCVMDDDDW